MSPKELQEFIAQELQEIIARRVAETDPMIKALSIGISSVCLCGSSRFCDVIAVCAWEFEKRGTLVYGMHLLPDWYQPTVVEGRNLNADGGHYAEAEGVETALDNLHLEKIKLANAVFVVNLDWYIGERTKAEIVAARTRQKPVFHLMEARR